MLHDVFGGESMSGVTSGANSFCMWSSPGRLRCPSASWAMDGSIRSRPRNDLCGMELESVRQL